MCYNTRMHIDFPDLARAKALFEQNKTSFEAFYELLIAYNGRYNLTAITQKEEVLHKHFYDSLLGEPYFEQGAACVEIGSGAGFPSIPLMIARRDLRVTLVESTGKKCEFLRTAIKELGLFGEVVNARAEELAKSAALAQEKIALLTAKIDPALELAALLGEIAALRETMTNLSAAKGRLQGLIETDDAQKKRLADKLEAIRSQEKKLGVWTQLNALIGSADGKRYRTFVQSMTFETLLHHANRALAKISQRYILKKDATEPLKLNVIDTFQGGVERSADNLSGGESFLVSLSLALGLSEMASRNVRVESLFLDEGFGSLDPDTLEDAMNALAALQSEGKMIGIISHVGEVRERIATLIDVTPVSGGRSELSGPGVERLEEKKK